MSRVTGVVVAAGLLSFGLAGCANDSNAATADDAGDADVVNIANVAESTEAPASSGEAAEQFVIDIANFQFTPADAVVPVGTEVVWTNSDTELHSIISNGEQFTSSGEFDTGQSYSFVFTEPGTYDYICGVHPFMEGAVTVE